MFYKKNNKFLLFLVGTALSTALGVPVALAASLNEARLSNATQEPQNWMTHGGGYNELHYSALGKINADNVNELKLAWTGDFADGRGQESTPLVVDGVMYVSSSWSKVYAYEAATGKELWRYDPQVNPEKAQNACCDVVNRGLAAWNGKIYVGTIDGRLEAIDAKSGKLVWSKQTTDLSKPYSITGAPRAVKGKILIGNGGAEMGVRGYISAYDAETGNKVWRFYTTPNPENKPDGEISDKILMDTVYGTWGDGAWRRTGGGGTVWDSIVYDAEFDQVLIGVGNGSPWSYKERSGGVGDNLFLGSILALDPDTGAYKWHYQETPAEAWDFTSAQPMILTDINIHGEERKVILHAPKNGFFYVIDRKSGKLVSAEKYATANWASRIDKATGRPVVMPGARYDLVNKPFLAMPGAFGAHNWHPMALNPKTGLTYIPIQELAWEYKSVDKFNYAPGDGNWNVAIHSATVEGPKSEADREVLAKQSRGALIAWDAENQKEVWRVQHKNVSSAGVLTTAGNLVFQGTADGRFVAYRADNGQKVWSWQGSDGIIAGAMSYEVAGQQYIAVLSGYGGANALHVPFSEGTKVGTNGRVLVFSLNGQGTFTSNEKLKAPVVSVAEKPDPAAVKRGQALYEHCAACHGFGTYSNNVIPDLRRSMFLTEKNAWKAVVIDGVLLPRGMPSWKGRLSEDEAQDIRAFILDRAAQQKADEVAMSAPANAETMKTVQQAKPGPVSN